jgi:hypothetical protein
MTRQYWTSHKREEGLITNNSHIAALLINNFRQPEIPIELYAPYQAWRKWLAHNLKRPDQPKEKP